jgi:hypothetical protein
MGDVGQGLKRARQRPRRGGQGPRRGRQGLRRGRQGIRKCTHGLLTITFIVKDRIRKSGKLIETYCA